MNKIVRLVFKTVDDYRAILPRIVVGLVFLSEGIQKFIFPGSLGAARFEKIGFENPEFLAAFVASFEMACGALILIGFSVRMAAITLFIIMATAIVTTKIPILVEEGFWRMAHEARTDFAMTLLVVFLFIYGAGKLSVDDMIKKRMK